MYEYSKSDAPFSGLADQKNLEELIDYLEQYLKIEVIKCHLESDALEQRKLKLDKTLEVKRLELPRPDSNIINSYEQDVRDRIKTLLDKSLLSCGKTNRERYHYLVKQVKRAQDLLDYYTYKNPVSSKLSDIDIIEICGEAEAPSNFHLLHLSDRLIFQLNRDFKARRDIFWVVYQLIFYKAMDYGDFIEEKGNNYGWKQIEKAGKKPSNPENEIYELAFALAYSEKLEYLSGKDENTFIKEFLNFFNLPPDNMSDYKSRLSERTKRVAPFLQELIEVVEREKPVSSPRKSKAKNKLQ